MKFPKFKKTAAQINSLRLKGEFKDEPAIERLARNVESRLRVYEESPNHLLLNYLRRDLALIDAYLKSKRD
jgi:hypothetical protein